MPVKDKRLGAVIKKYDMAAEKSASVAKKAEGFVSVTGKGVVNPGLRNYAADPFFVRKAEEAKAEIDKVGLPRRKS